MMATDGNSLVQDSVGVNKKIQLSRERGTAQKVNTPNNNHSDKAFHPRVSQKNETSHRLE